MVIFKNEKGLSYINEYVKSEPRRPCETRRDVTYEGRAKRSVTDRLPWFYPRSILNCFPTDLVTSNWNRCSHIHWPNYLLHWNIDQKTEIRSYIKCHIRLNIDSKQIFNELCGIYGPQTISMRTVLGVLKLLKLGNFLLKMIPVLEGLKPLLPRLTSLL